MDMSPQAQGPPEQEALDHRGHILPKPPRPADDLHPHVTAPEETEQHNSVEEGTSRSYAISMN